MHKKSRLPLFAGLASLMVSGVVLSMTYAYVKHLSRLRFQSEVERVRQSFIEKTTASELLALTLQNFAQIDPTMDKADFQTIVDGIMLNYSFVRSANFYKLVPATARKEHEIWLQSQTDVPGMVDSSSDDPDATVPAAERTAYLSLIYADLKSADNTVFGWNVFSDGRREPALQKAIESAKASASDGFLLDDGHAAVEVFVPFYHGGKIPDNKDARVAALAGIIGMTIDLPLLLGDEEWRKNVTVMLSTTLAGSDRLRDLFRSLDKEPEGIMPLGFLETEVDLQSFGQGLRLLFIKDLYFSRLNYGILLLVFGGCVVVTLLASNLGKTLVRLAKSLHDLASLNAGLEQKVAERTRDLARTNAEIQEILDKLDDGILIIDRKLQIDARFSPSTPKLLGVEALAGQSVKDLIFGQLDPHQEDASRHNFTLPMLFGADDFQWSISHDNLLKQMTYKKPAAGAAFEERQFSLRYAPLYDEQGNIQRILLVITDITEVLALRRFVEEARTQGDQRMQMIMEILQAERQSMQGFMLESASRAESLRQGIQKLQPDFPLPVLQAIFREVHTFKGNARMLKLSSLSKAAHLLEDAHAENALSGTIDAKTGEDLILSLETLMKLTDQYQSTFVELYGAGQSLDHSAEMRREWLEVLRSGLSARTLSQLLEGQNQKDIFSFSEIWKGYQPMVDDIAGHLSKQVKPLQIRGNIYLKSKLQTPIKDALTHLVRNALDHGIESPQQRNEAGKNHQAEILVQIALRGESALVEVQDDGRGVDADRVWLLALDRGVVPHGSTRPSDAEVWELLFHPGFSTKAEVSDISGRGVGLDAVRSFLNEFGCRVEIFSQKGQGTSFRLVIPLQFVSALWNESGTVWDGQDSKMTRAS